MSDTGALLLLLLDSRAPSGGHNHSMGMESAINLGLVRDQAGVQAFCQGRLRTSGRVAAAFAGGAHDLVTAQAAPPEWGRLEEEFDARTPSAAMRAASRQLGSGLHRLARAMLTEFDIPAQHHAVVLGAAVAVCGGDRSLAARAAALGTVSVPASAALRILGLDPFGVHRMLAELAEEIDTMSSPPAGLALPCDAAPALDLLAEHHLTTEVRLFAS